MFDKFLIFLGFSGFAPDERDLYPQYFKPKITVGSIVFSALTKLAFMILAAWFVVEMYQLERFWWIALPVIWLIAIYPAFLQYQRFKEYSMIIRENTLCAKCKHYDETGILCKIYDEHISATNIPCGGESWEARSS